MTSSAPCLLPSIRFPCCDRVPHYNCRLHSPQCAALKLVTNMPRYVCADSMSWRLAGPKALPAYTVPQKHPHSLILQLHCLHPDTPCLTCIVLPKQAAQQGATANVNRKFYNTAIHNLQHRSHLNYQIHGPCLAALPLTTHALLHTVAFHHNILVLIPPLAWIPPH